MDSQIETAALNFRRELLVGDEASIKRLTATYADIWQKLKPEIDRLLYEIQYEAPTPTPAQLARKARYQLIENQIHEELSRFGDFGAQVIREQQLTNVALGEAHTKALAEIGLGKPLDGFKGPTWAKLPTQAIQDLVGFASDGSPLTDVLKHLAPDAVSKVTSALISGLAAGNTPAMIARQIRDDFGGSLARAQLIAATEEHRAYTSSSLRAMQENSHIVEGWEWHASLSYATCGSCLAMHGTRHPLSEPFGSHPACRCIPTPYVEDSEPSESGEEWLSRQSEANQLRTLGPSKFELYKAGKLKLSDLVKETHSEKWGVTRTEKSLKELGLPTTSRKPSGGSQKPSQGKVKGKAGKVPERAAKDDELADLGKLTGI